MREPPLPRSLVPRGAPVLPVPDRGAGGPPGPAPAAAPRTGCCPACATGCRICRDCAGITRDFSCLRCGTETGMATGGRRSLSRLCGPCAVAWTAARLLDDGTGAVGPPLKPLADALAATPARPPRWNGWTSRTSASCSRTWPPGRCRSPTRHSTPGPGRVPWSTCVTCWSDCGVLPAADKQLRDFQAWLDRRLEALAGHPHLRLLRQFGLWHQLPRMRATGRRRAAARHRLPVRPEPVPPGRRPS